MALLDILLGRPLASSEEEAHRVGVLEAIPMLGLDALSSAAYGPEAALILLLPLGLAGPAYLVPISGIILILLTILFFSYRQTIAAYPAGGGSYTVAKENLGVPFGLLAAAALLLDYVLTVAVGISAGVGALVSAVPALHGHILSLCLLMLVLMALVNLRGIRESGAAWLLPTYLFIGSLSTVLAIGLFKTAVAGGHPVPVITPPPLPHATEGVTLWLLLRAFASGCTAMTGVEAVSNGVNAFSTPAVQRAQRTLTAIIVVLAVFLAGLAVLVRAYDIGAMLQDQSGYQSVISQVVAAVVGRGWFYYLTLGSVLAVLCLSANTSFADFPRLCRLVAEDDFLPHGFANKGRRLVYSLGIFILSILAAFLLILFGGITDRLIPLFAVGAFLAFTLSQAGMVAHWRRTAGPRARMSLVVNAAGAAATAVALSVVVVAKFRAGAWLTVLVIPAVLVLFLGVKRHYQRVRRETQCSGPLDVTGLDPPVVVIPTLEWDAITAKALRFALRLSPDIVAVHVSTDPEDAGKTASEWQRSVEPPLREAGLPLPRLVTLASPYRYVIGPVIQFIRQLEREHPTRQIAVIIPELVEAHWWEFPLHNQRGALLRAALLFRGDRRIVVIEVPWHLKDREAHAP